jgi:Xaa-Pro aminopeptidase
MKNFPSETLLFSDNRRELMGLLPDESLAIVAAADFMPKSADQNFPFYQNSDFFYLTGLNQEKSIVCLCKSHPNPAMREVLFLLAASPELETWTGHRYTREEAMRISGIQTIISLDDFSARIKEFMVFSQQIFVPSNESTNFVTEISTYPQILANTLKKDYPFQRFERLSPVLREMRLIKKPAEVEFMKHAASISRKILNRILNCVKPGLFEYQISAEITHEVLWNGGSGHAFEPIVASGKNACVLHYVTPNDQLKNGDLLLIDFGAEWKHYASDCSRTIPVGGTFSKRQRECYEAVLRVFKKAKALYVPGNTINGINEQVNRWMEEEMIGLGLFSKKDVKNQNPDAPLFKKYFMHGTAHFVGLDVHDTGFKHTPLKKAMVLTCEPGLYISEENIGIRIENMMIVDDIPVDLMENYPVEADEIERLMQQRE